VPNRWQADVNPRACHRYAWRPANTGDYSRHAFSYVIPAGEAGAGATVSIQLLSEYLAHARQAADAPVQEWRRCQPGVS
jgi:hypothetical protein